MRTLLRLAARRPGRPRRRRGLRAARLGLAARPRRRRAVARRARTPRPPRVPRRAALRPRLHGGAAALDLRSSGVDAWIGLSILEAAFYGVLGVALGRVSTAAAVAAVDGRLLGRGRAAALAGALGRLPVGTARVRHHRHPARAAPWRGSAPPARRSSSRCSAPRSPGWCSAGRPGAGRPPRPPRLAAAAWLRPRGAPSRPGCPTPEPTGTVQVAAVQGNVPGEGMEAFAERRAVLDNHVAATLDLADARSTPGRRRSPDFVLWPENSTDIDPFEDPTRLRRHPAAPSTPSACPILVGAMVDGPGPLDVKNQGIVWSPGTGPGERYSKTHPVPFGEYIPMRAQLAKLFERLDQIPRDMVPGTEPGRARAGRHHGRRRDLLRGRLRRARPRRRATAAPRCSSCRPTTPPTWAPARSSSSSRSPGCGPSRPAATSSVVATNGVSGIVAPDGSVVQRAPVRDTSRHGHRDPAAHRPHARRAVGGASAAGSALVALVAVASPSAPRRAGAARRAGVRDAAATGREPGPGSRR